MAFQYESKPSKMAQMVIRLSGGLIKDEDQANYVLLWLAVIAFVIAAYLTFGTLRGPRPYTPPPGYHIVHPEGEPSRLEKDSDQ